jgi:hypothetical protein
MAEVLAQRELRTKWGDMFLENSMLVGDELLVQGSSHAAQNIVAFEIQVLAADTLAWQRNLDQKQTLSLRDSLVANGTTYALTAQVHSPKKVSSLCRCLYIPRRRHSLYTITTHCTKPTTRRNRRRCALHMAHNCWLADVADNQKF